MRVLNRTEGDARQSSLFHFTQGIDLDQRLFSQELRVQSVWAWALGEAGILAHQDVSLLQEELEHLGELMAAGRFEWREEDEDIHMNIERHLTSRLGELGKKIHEGRSRNDLIATSLRLFVEESTGQISRGVHQVLASLIGRAEASLDVLVPGMTHLQHAQPVRFSHVLAGHGLALTRDLRRLQSAQATCLESMPLGSAALAGTTVDVPLAEMAKQLGFLDVSHNSYDSVGDRDFMLEALDAFASLAVHLSRLSEDIIYWSSTAVGLVQLSPAWSTGSSIMPNKRNPDVAELTRAKCAQVIGQAQSAKILLKGLPSSYASDLHELKRVYQQAFDQLAAVLPVLAEFIHGLEVNIKRAGELLRLGHIMATDIANHLTAQGLPFREAYLKVAEWVWLADQKGVTLEDIANEQGLNLPHLSPQGAVETRSLAGGTSREQVEKCLALLRARLG